MTPEHATPDVRSITAGQTQPLRNLVLRPGLPASACTWEGDDASGSFHVGAFVDGELVAIASVMAEPMPRHHGAAFDPHRTYRLRGMATHPDHRGQGHGSALLKYCIERIRADGGEVLWCNARTSAVGFYRRHGWRALGEEFDLPGIGPHFMMWLDVCEGNAAAGA